MNYGRPRCEFVAQLNHFAVRILRSEFVTEANTHFGYSLQYGKMVFYKYPYCTVEPLKSIKHDSRPLVKQYRCFAQPLEHSDLQPSTGTKLL